MDKAQDVAPEWAWKRLRELKAEVGTSIINPTEVAFARYIASKEEAPVDPLLREAVEIVVGLYPDYTGLQQIAIREGKWHQDDVELALAALKRGLALAGRGEGVE